MSQPGELDQIAIQIKPCALESFSIKLERDGLRDLCDFQRVRQPITKEIRLKSREELRLALQAAESGGVYEARSIAPER